jgi:hypothetical protein
MKYTGWCQNDFNVQGYCHHSLAIVSPVRQYLSVRYFQYHQTHHSVGLNLVPITSLEVPR